MVINMDQYIINRINILQKELDDIKKILSSKKQSNSKNTLKGIWKNTILDDQDFWDAKQSLIKQSGTN
jgi:hypothetical protein